MSRTLLVVTFLFFTGLTVAQPKKIQEITISQLLVWNKTTIYDTYSGARASNKTGKAWSNGINVNYSFGINKYLFANVGIGYFNQRFGIQRGFDFFEPNVTTGLFYSTKKYAYKSFHYFGGMGYRKIIASKSKGIIPQNSEFRFLALFNLFNTFQQVFQHDFNGNLFGNPNPQIRKLNYQYGSSVFLKAGIVRPIFKHFKLGIDLLLPVYNKWRKDEIFKENTNEYHGADFSIGTSLNLIYNLKK
jgi:hypothetical protein